MYDLLCKYISKKTALSEKEIKYICSHFKLEIVKNKQNLVDFNDTCSRYYFINRGSLRIFTINEEGFENSRLLAFEGTFCTALPSFIDQKPAFEYLQSLEKSEVLSISREDFFKLVEEFSAFDKLYREILEISFIISQQRIYSFQGFDALEKVKWLIENQPQVLLKVSNKIAASYLGLSPSTLSRVKSKL